MKKDFILGCFLFLFGILSYAQNQKQWIEDIEYFQETLEAKHINVYHTISKNEFNSEIENLKSNLSHLSEFQIIVELMRITQKIGGGKGDGHTSVPLWDRKLHKFPIKLYKFEGEIKVLAISKKHKHILGKTLESINGIPINKIFNEVSKLTPFTENKYSMMDRTCRYLVIAEILEAISVSKNTKQAEFTFKNTNKENETIALSTFNNEDFTNLEFEAFKISHPSIEQPINSKPKNLWFTSLNDAKTVYIKFKAYPSEDEMKSFSKNVYQFINQNNSEHLIIDLRENYGGDFYKGLLLSSYLNLCDSINWESNVYVLTNRKTYSAAMVNAILYKQLLSAKLVGEPTGANPNGYQDLGQFSLPNSKLLITYSKRLFRLSETNTEGVQPDVIITPKIKNYLNGYDEVLDWVLNDIEGIN